MNHGRIQKMWLQPAGKSFLWLRGGKIRATDIESTDDSVLELNLD